MMMLGVTLSLRELTKPLNESVGLLPLLFIGGALVVFLTSQWIWERSLHD